MDNILLQLKKAGRVAFRTREYSALLGKKGYARLVLHRLKKKGEIKLVKKGWWAFPDAIPEAVACEISRPCYVSFFSALALHGLTTQTPRIIQVAVARNAKTYNIFEMKVKEYKIKKSVFTGFYREEGLLLASPEKAFADCIIVPRTCPEIILTEVIEKIDVEKARAFLVTIAAQRRLKRLIKYVKQGRY